MTDTVDVMSISINYAKMTPLLEEKARIANEIIKKRMREIEEERASNRTNPS